MNLWFIFLTGLTSGGVTCAAMQGGILASTIANQKKLKVEPGFGADDWGGVAAFLTTKLIAHVILGFFLGWLGSAISLSLGVRLFFQGFAALFMFASAMNLLEVHPIFRYVVVTPPKFARRLIKNNMPTDRLFAPGLLGFLTVLIPCGVTQAMEVLAISSGSSVQGALIMGSFVLGTAPMFVLIGLATAKLSEVWRVYFLRTAAVLLIAMALYSINGILQVSDSNYSLERIGPRIVKLLPPYDTTPRSVTPTPALVDGVQPVTINILNSGYSPRRFAVKSGVPVKLTVNAGEVYSCATAFTFRAFGINAFVKPNTNQVFTFTPDKKGLYTFSCSMGMYSGTMEVI
ncbi:MAG: sulfite exporter TauE/SafE family protein [Microgenomates group bacterium]